MFTFTTEVIFEVSVSFSTKSFGFAVLLQVVFHGCLCATVFEGALDDPRNLVHLFCKK